MRVTCPECGHSFEPALPYLTVDQRRRVLEVWNAFRPKECPQATRINEKRARALAARVKERSSFDAFLDELKRALLRLQNSRFARGYNDRGWRANLDWIARPGVLDRILEGQFDDRRKDLQRDYRL